MPTPERPVAPDLARGNTTAQLRHAIDRGLTGSKVAARDPAAAPLGTDEEAAGTPPHPDVVARTLQREMSNPAAAHAHRPEPVRHRTTLMVVLVIGIAAGTAFLANLL